MGDVLRNIKIDKYKIEGDDNRYHNVPEHLASEFQEAVHELGRKYKLHMNMNYSTNEEEYETTPDDQENIHHPLSGIKKDQLGDILDPIEIYYFKVINHQAEVDLRFYVPSDGVKSFKHYLKSKGYKFVAEFGTKSFSTARYQELCKDLPTDIIPIRIGVYEDNLAHEFEEELAKRNINKEDLIMTTATQEQNSTSTSTADKAMQEENLMKYIGSCTRAFLDELILTFNDEDALKLYQYAHSTKKKQDVMYKTITKDLEKGSDQLNAVKEFHNYVECSAESVKEAQATMKSYKGGLRKRVNDIDNQFKIEPETRKAQQDILGQQKCCKLIENGLKGYGKAVVAGHVIGKQDQVVAAANFISVEVSQIVKHQDLSNKSLEGVKKVYKGVNKPISSLVKRLQDDKGDLNAKADSLVAYTVDQRKGMEARIKDFVSQSVGK